MENFLAVCLLEWGWVQAKLTVDSQETWFMSSKLLCESIQLIFLLFFEDRIWFLKKRKLQITVKGLRHFSLRNIKFIFVNINFLKLLIYQLSINRKLRHRALIGCSWKTRRSLVGASHRSDSFSSGRHFMCKRQTQKALSEKTSAVAWVGWVEDVWESLSFLLWWIFLPLAQTNNINFPWHPPQHRTAT